MPMIEQTSKEKSAAVKPLRLDGEVARQVRRGFGIDPARLSLGESPEVAAMGARAVAKGNIIRFAPGEFAPETREGRETLGHELEHVRAQASGEVPLTGGLLEQPSYEAAADRAGAAFASGTLAAGRADVGPLPAQSAPAQMRRKKLKQPLIPYTGPEVDQQSEDFQKNLQDLFTTSGGVRSANFLTPVAQNTFLPYYEEIFENLNQKEKEGFDFRKATDRSRGTVHQEDKGDRLATPESIAMNREMLQRLTGHLDRPEVQDYLKLIGSHEGGMNWRTYQKAMTNDGTKKVPHLFEDYIMSLLPTKGMGSDIATRMMYASLGEEPGTARELNARTRGNNDKRQANGILRAAIRT